MKGQVLSVFKCVVVEAPKVRGLEVGRVRSLDFIPREIGTVGRF